MTPDDDRLDFTTAFGPKVYAPPRARSVAAFSHVRDGRQPGSRSAGALDSVRARRKRTSGRGAPRSAVTARERDRSGVDSDCSPCVPGESKDECRNRESDQRIGPLETERDNDRGRDDAKRDVAVDASVVSVGDERGTVEATPGSEARVRRVGCEA
jgi:hypothetical protein